MPIEREATAAMDDVVCLNVPTDAFMEIVLRLHPSKRPVPGWPTQLAFVVNYKQRS